MSGTFLIQIKEKLMKISKTFEFVFLLGMIAGLFFIDIFLMGPASNTLILSGIAAYSIFLYIYLHRKELRFKINTIALSFAAGGALIPSVFVTFWNIYPLGSGLGYSLLFGAQRFLITFLAIYLATALALIIYRYTLGLLLSLIILLIARSFKNNPSCK